MTLKKKNIDTVILVGGHALILGHMSAKLTAAQVNSKLERDPQDLCKLGLFDSSTPNYTTFYPDVTAEDLNPKDEEFIEPIFRMLSNVTVHAKHNPINFPEAVLKKAMYKLIGQTVNIDHETALGNAIGTVKSVEWQNAYTANGIKVPAGINAVLKIDGKSNPRIARGIMMDPPSIHSNSVTVNFAWEKSHTEMEDNEFYSKLGSYGKDGKLIQRVVTDIIAFHETSLVSHGADPFAQQVKDGKIVNPIYAKQNYSLSADKEPSPLHFFDWKQYDNDYIDTISNSFKPENNNSQNNTEEMKNLFSFLEKQYGLEADSLTEENYEQLVDEAIAKSQNTEDPAPVVILEFEGEEAIEAELTRLAQEVIDLNTTITNNETLVTVGQTALTELRAETSRLYKLSVEEGKEDASILGVIEKADYKTLQSFHKQYLDLTEGRFEQTCTDCGSHNITRASASAGDPPSAPVNKSSNDVISKFTSVNAEPLPSSLRD